MRHATAIVLACLTAGGSVAFAQSLTLLGVAGAMPGSESSTFTVPRTSSPRTSTSTASPSFPLRFDLATLLCGAPPSRITSAPIQDRSFCPEHFFHLNRPGAGRHLAVGTGRHHTQVRLAGNAEALYVNDMNTDWAKGAQVRADAIMAKAKVDFPLGLPQWVLLNEISASRWPAKPEYRQYVVDLATRLKDVHGFKVIVFAPFERPGHNVTHWKALARVAFVGVERYLTGARINASGNSVAWCLARYRESLMAYSRVGVPAARQLLTENFAQSVGGTAWGRAGVSSDGWKNAVRARTQAALRLPFAGLVSYGWAGNHLHVPDPDRLDIEDLYVQLTLK